jgi:hypothetical protein
MFKRCLAVSDENGRALLFAMHNRFLPLSSLCGMNENIEKVVLPLFNMLLITLSCVIFFDSICHEIRASGREPSDRQRNCMGFPSISGPFGGVINTFKGLTVSKSRFFIFRG